MKVLPWRSFHEATKGLHLFRLASLDVGSKHVGVAVTDESRMFSSPLRSFERLPPRMSPASIGRLALRLQNLSNEWKVAGFVVGLPLLEKGELTPLSREIMELTEKLSVVNEASNEPCLCTFWNERNTSVRARRIISTFSGRRSVVLKNKDTVSASLILQGYIDATKEL